MVEIYLFFVIFAKIMEKTTKIDNEGYYQLEICSDRLIFLPMYPRSSMHSFAVNVSGSSCRNVWFLLQRLGYFPNPLCIAIRIHSIVCVAYRRLRLT